MANGKNKDQHPIVYDSDSIQLAPYHVEVLFARQNNDVVDILVPLTNSQYSALISHLEDKHQNWQRSSYLYIFQNQISHYEQWYDQNLSLMTVDEQNTEKKVHGLMQELRHISELYAPLEALINKRPSMNEDLGKALLHHLEALAEGIQNNAQISSEFKKDMLEDITKFTAETKKVLSQIPRSTTAIRNLFCLSREESDLPCLGYFLSQQLFELGDIGKKQLNEITDKDYKYGKTFNRLSNQFKVPFSQNRLSDAKSQIERKRSAYGTEFNSNRVAIPLEMLQSLTTQTDEFDVNGGPVKRWTSLSRYISRMDDREEIDALLREVSQFSGNPPCPLVMSEDKKYSTLDVAKQQWAQAANKGILAHITVALNVLASYMVVPFTVIEMAIPSVPRIAIAFTVGLINFVTRDLIYNPASYIVSRIGYFTARIFNAFRSDPNGLRRAGLDQWLDRVDEARQKIYDGFGNIVDTIDQGLSSAHAGISPVIIAKTQRDSFYTEDERKELHQQLGQAKSFFVTILDTYNSEAFSDFLRDTVNSLAGTVVSLGVTIRTIFGHGWSKLTSKDYSETLYNKYKLKTNDALLEEFKNIMRESEKNTSSGQPTSQSSAIEKYAMRQSVRDMERPHIESFMHFMQSIVVVLGDEIFDSVFRKSPGFATLSFMAACASFGVLMAPHSAPAFAAFSEKFAMATMGKEAGGAGSTTVIMNNMFTAVLEFKTLFVTMEVMKGDVKLLKDIMKNPEEVMLAFMIASSMGLLMSFIPPMPANVTTINMGLGKYSEMPNIYASGLNLFIEEAVECAHHGTPGATAIEFSFLSAKLGFLIQSMTAGLHNPTHITSPILESMTDSYQKLDKTTAPTTVDGLKQHFKDLFITHKIDDHDQKILIDQFHHTLVFNAMFKTYKDVKSQRINASTHNGVTAAYKPVTVDVLRTEFNQIFTVHGIARDKQENFIEAFQNSQEFAQKQSKISTNGFLQGTLPTEEKTVLTPRDELMKMFRLVRNLDMSGVSIESSLEKNALFDMLYESVENYNRDCIQRGYPALVFDGDEYLESFYNKYVYRGSNNFWRSVQIFFLPTLLATFVWRKTQRAVAYIYNELGIPSHALNQKLDKSYAKDKFLALQSIAMFGRLGQSALRAITYGIIRVAILSVGISLATVTMIMWPPAYKKSWNNIVGKAIDVANLIRPYKTFTVPLLMRTEYAQAISKADTHNENLTKMSESAIAKLEHAAHLEKTTTPINPPAPVITSQEGKAAVHKHNLDVQRQYHESFLGLDKAYKDLKGQMSDPKTIAAMIRSPEYNKLTTIEKTLKSLTQSPPKTEYTMKIMISQMKEDQKTLSKLNELIATNAAKPKNGQHI